MSEDKMLTDTGSLRARLEAAKRRERDARALASRLRREMAHADRRREAQMLCTLGRAWLALGERSESFRATGARFLAAYISRDTDREALRGTPWAVPEVAAAAGEAPSEGGRS